MRIAKRTNAPNRKDYVGAGLRPALILCLLCVIGCVNEKGPTGESAKELYIKARGIEDRTAADHHEAENNLQEAREAYRQALQLKPPAALEAYIRAGLANVSFFLDDYPTAIEEWTTAYPRLGEPDLKAWALYRIGLSQQRLGRFEQADRTFWRVMDEFPTSVPAVRAKEKAGARQFYLQLASFVSIPTADAAAMELRKKGMTPLMNNDEQGKRVMRLGPYHTYGEAKSMKAKMADDFADAMIVP